MPHVGTRSSVSAFIFREFIVKNMTTADNMAMARRYSRYAADRGCVPLTPHLWLPQFLSEETERDLAINIDLRFLSLCQELWVCGNEPSEGMRRELEQATLAGMPVRFVKEEDINVRN